VCITDKGRGICPFFRACVLLEVSSVIKNGG
jgi:hypothetical protein